MRVGIRVRGFHLVFSSRAVQEIQLCSSAALLCCHQVEFEDAQSLAEVLAGATCGTRGPHAGNCEETEYEVETYK